MAIDMSQFYQVFFEETEEHLASMESLLLDLDVGAPDPEQLNAVFRAAHSIKGSSGTFGFTDLADVTHILENLLDRVRKGELALREEMIDAFLAAGDVLKVLLAAHRGEGERDPVAVEAICARLRGLTEGGSGGESPAVRQVPAAVETIPTGGGGGGEGLDLRFVLEKSGGGDAAANLIAELEGCGSVRILTRGDDGQAWHLELHGQANAEDVRGILEFVARTDSIRVAALGTLVDGAEGSADGAYGFFSDPPTAIGSQEEAYGLFEAPAVAGGPTPASSEASGETAYGFFQPVDTPTPGGASAGETAYGFFVDPATVKVQTASPVESVAAVKPADAGDGSYGFFAELPAPPALAPDATAPARSAEPAAPLAAVATPVAPAARETAAPQEARKAASKPMGGGDTSIRVSVEKVDQLINLVGELVITQAMLAQAAEVLDPVEFERLHNGLVQLERNSRDLQEAVMSIRMMPISVVFSRFPRVVRDLSQKLGKHVELKLIGEDTELDKSLVERITDPLTHLVRNSLDHGIESPEERTAKGKQASGTITLKAYHQSGHIVIEVSDDGAGLNRQRILSKARERGLPVHDQMGDSEVCLLIFEAGFSTADKVTEVSGRGVGMDVVKRNITAMGGRVEIESMLGIGTRMTVR
ncbi:MAG: Hpt domain-containing protein, partial [Rhodocyclaceae bacterium]|nr:Hpt domain-containing protein [Rhodocyclaceae bacterium]